jgi:hypothetical protein
LIRISERESAKIIAVCFDDGYITRLVEREHAINKKECAVGEFDESGLPVSITW